MVTPRISPPPRAAGDQRDGLREADREAGDVHVGTGADHEGHERLRPGDLGVAALGDRVAGGEAARERAHEPRRDGHDAGHDLLEVDHDRGRFDGDHAHRAGVARLDLDGDALLACGEAVEVDDGAEIGGGEIVPAVLGGLDADVHAGERVGDGDIAPDIDRVDLDPAGEEAAPDGVAGVRDEDPDRDAERKREEQQAGRAAHGVEPAPPPAREDLAGVDQDRAREVRAGHLRRAAARPRRRSPRRRPVWVRPRRRGGRRGSAASGAAAAR